MKTAVTRRFAPMVCSALLSIVLVACGGGSNSSSQGSSSGSSNGSAPGTPTSGSTNSGGSGSPTTGTPGGGTGGGSGSSGSTYVYASIYTDAGGVDGYRVNSTSGDLTTVPGSPYIQQGSAGMGAMASFNGYVYMANIPGSQNMPGNRTQLIYYRVDPSTGALTQVDTSDAGVGTNGDSGMRKLVVSPAHSVMYGVFQYTISTFSISSTGMPSFVSSTTPSTDSMWGFDVVSNGAYAYAAIQNGNPKQGFRVPQMVLLNIGADGTITTNRTLFDLNNASGIAGDLKVDPSGKYVIVSNGQSNEQLSVYAIQTDGSLTEVPGSPFATGSQQLHYLAFDSTGKFLYAVNQHAEQPQAEDLEVFSFDALTGTLAKVQDLPQPNEQNVTWLKVDGNEVYLVNVVGGNHSTITVFNRDPNTGQLTQAAVNQVQNAIGQIDVAHE